MAVPEPSAPAVQRERAAAAKRRRKDNEGPTQRAILSYLRVTLPSGWIVQHTPNNPRNVRQGARDKRNGAVAGWPDLGIYGPGPNGPSAWFAEIKPPGVSVPDHQRKLHDRLIDAGFHVRILRSVEDARKAIADWELPSNDSMIARRSA